VLATNHSETRELQYDAIVRLERSIRPSRKVRGALIGFGVGFVTMFTLSALVTEGDCVRSPDAAACVSAIVAPGERWADVPLGARSHGTTARSAGPELRLVPLVGRRSGLALVASF
jgi:hypothetical protein